MSDANEDQSVATPLPGMPGRVSIRGSKEADTTSGPEASADQKALSEIRADIKVEGPETPVNLSENLRAADVRTVTDHTLPQAPTPGATKIEVAEPAPKGSIVAGSTLTLDGAKTDLSAGIFSPLRAAAIAFLRQFKRLRTAASNP